MRKAHLPFEISGPYLRRHHKRLRMYLQILAVLMFGMAVMTWLLTELTP